MVSKTLSPNFPPWDWRIERAPEHVDSGPETAKSVNDVQRDPSMENRHALKPLVLTRELLSHTEQPCLEDGKESVKPK